MEMETLLHLIYIFIMKRFTIAQLFCCNMKMMKIWKKIS
jgi:hypothetical protein